MQSNEEENSIASILQRFFFLFILVWDRVQDDDGHKKWKQQQWQLAAAAEVEKSQRNEPIFYDYT